MKKIVVICVALIMCVLLAGCIGSSETSTGGQISNSGVTVITDPTLAVIESVEPVVVEPISSPIVGGVYGNLSEPSTSLILSEVANVSDSVIINK